MKRRTLSLAWGISASDGNMAVFYELDLGLLMLL